MSEPELEAQLAGASFSTTRDTVLDHARITDLTVGTIHFPAGNKIISGSGAPAGSLATHAGDLYVNVTATTTTTRLYIATGVGAWTNFTTAA